MSPLREKVMIDSEGICSNSSERLKRPQFSKPLPLCLVSRIGVPSPGAGHPVKIDVTEVVEHYEISPAASRDDAFRTTSIPQ